MILQPDAALAGKILERLGKLVGGSVGVLSRLGPTVEVHLDNRLAVQFYLDDVLPASDPGSVPLAGFLTAFTDGAMQS